MTDAASLERAIALLESQRAALGDELVETALESLRAKLEALKTPAGPPGQQRKTVSILFADISGFTALSETLDVEEVADFLNSLWERLDGIILARGGLVDKHIGDALMALWGVQTVREDDAEQAVHAALELQVEVERWKEIAGQPAAAALKMRIGVNTGPAMLGPVGIRNEYTALGDAVNVAARLESAAPVGSILISQATYHHVRGLFNLRPQGALSLHGKAEAVPAYLVEGRRPRAFRQFTRGVEGVETRMVGRQAELRSLQEAWQAVSETRSARLVSVVGEAGVGKSRLMYEFQSWLQHISAQAWVFQARAGPDMQQPFALLRDGFAARFEMRESDPLSVAQHKLVDGVARVMENDTEAAMKGHFIGHLLGLDFSASPYLRGILDDPKQIHSRAFHYLAQFFAAAAQQSSAAIQQSSAAAPQPVIFLLDDLHWSDSGSLDFLAYLWQRSRQQPLFILGLARPTLFEQDTPWGQLIQAHIRIDLQPLALQESRSLVDQILQHVDQIPSTLYERIENSAEGNPFYMEELIKIMIDRQVILTHTMPWQIDAQRLEGLPIPPTLSGVLQARLDGLAEGERQTLQKAAVVGRIFWDQALSFMSTASPQVMDAFEAQLLAQIEALAQRGLIFSHPASAFAGAEEYAFKHILLQEVTYETLLKKQRPLYHALAAEWLVDACGDRANEYAARIAEHWNKAGKTALAAEWYGRAADHARKNYALEAAITYYRKALADPGLLSTDQTIHFYKGLGAALSSRSLYAEALKVYAALQALAQAGGDSLAQAQMLKNIAWLQERQGNISASLAYLEQALALLQTLPGDRAVRAEQAVILARKGWGLCHQGDARGALACGEGALALVAGESDPESLDARARGYNTLGTAHQMLGHFSEALHCRQQSLELHRALNNQRSVGTSLNNLGEIARMQGDYASAVEYYRMALKITQETGDLGGEMIRLSNLGGAQVGLGEYAAAERSLLLVIEKAGKTRQVVLVEAYCFLAEAYLGQGRGDEALAAVRTALELGQSLGNKTMLGEVWRTMGNCGLLVADLGADPSASPAELPASGALSPAFCFARSIEIFGETGAQHEQARTLRAWARYDLQRGDPSQGAQHWEAARAMFEALGMMLEVERMVLDF